MGEWQVRHLLSHRGIDYILLYFAGELTSEEGTAAVYKMKELVKGRPFFVVGEFSRLKNYESGARKAFQETLFPIRHQLSGVLGTTKSILIRMGVSTVCMVLSVPLEFVGSVEELVARVQARTGVKIDLSSTPSV